MPPPVSRRTLTSAARDTIIDEQKRKERVAAEKDQTGRPSASKVRGISVRRIDAKTTHYNALQKEKGDVRVDQGISRGVGGRVGDTGARSVSTSRMKDNSYDPVKYRDSSGLSSGATGTSSGLSSGATRTSSGMSSGTARNSSGVHPFYQTSGSVHDGKDVTGTSSSGQSSEATGTSSKGSSGFPSHKIQNPTASVPDPYGYTRISASQTRLYRDNLDFYQNKIYSKPTPGHTIEEMLTWKGNYSMLERNNRYIQWLFPIPEGNGLNLYAQQLYEHEAQAIRDDNAAHKRVLKAYKMMLDFYGMQLTDSVQGTVKRANKDWEEQYCHLNRSRHNFLLITRILKSIGKLGFERLQAPWVDFLIEEAVVKKVLPNLNGPCLLHWIMAVKDNGEREMLYRKASGLPINQDTATYDMDSEFDDGDEGDEVQTKGLDLTGSALSRLTLEQETAKDSELLQHVDTATAIFKQTKDADSVTPDSVSKRKDGNPIEKHVIDGAEATPTKAKSTSGAESASVALSKQKHVIPNEKPVNDKTDKISTAGIKTTATGEEAFRKKSGSVHDGKDVTGTSSSGQSSEATGTSSKGSSGFPSHKIQNPTASVPDPYGYTRISASQTRLYRDNLDFYQNKIYSKPTPGHTIEEMLTWKGNYSMLERNNRYIQWLFPIPEGNGLNLYAQQLYEHEAQAIRDDNAAHKRVLKAYKMMLDFYGMQLTDSVQGTVKRANKDWEEQYCHLNRSRHNFLLITRILKSIGELGFERLQAPWVDFLIEEAVVKKVLPNLNGPCLLHWIMAVKDNGEREMLYRKASGLPINQDTATYDMDSEFDDGDEGDEVQTKGLDLTGSALSRLTLEQETAKDSELLQHVDTATAIFKQTKDADSVTPDSVSKRKDGNPIEKHVIDGAEATPTKAKSTSGAESASVALSKQKHVIPNEKPVNDKTDKISTAGIKTTATGEEAFRKKSGSVHDGKDVTGTSSSGQSSEATGTSSKGSSGFPSHKIQNPTASVPDPYGYTRISASQTRLYRDNLDFYQNKIYSKPTPGHTIEEMLTWKGNYSMLERNNRYIQWLFPIPEGNGLNLYAQQLYEHEAQAIRDDNAAHKRVLKAYKMMLDFYGMQLTDSVQGTVKRANKDWEEQYCHLTRSRHNFLLITRILKSIGELGFERLQAPWVDFLIEEAVVKKVLPNLNGPCLLHWIMAVKDNGEREMLYRKASGLPINQDTATYDMDSEFDDGDEGDEVQTKGLDLTGSALSRLTLEQETAKDSELLQHVDTATAIFKQTKDADSVTPDSVSKRKDGNPIEKHVIDGAEATPTKAKSTSGAESASVALSKQKHVIPNEKPVNDKTDKISTAGIKTTATGEEAFRKKKEKGDVKEDKKSSGEVGERVADMTGARNVSTNITKDKGDVKEDKTSSGEVGGRVADMTGARNVSTNVTADNAYYPEKYRASSGPSCRDTRTSSGLSSGSTGTGSREYPFKHKIQNPTASVSDPSVYTRSLTGASNHPSDNLRFYQNNLHSRPSPGFTIEVMLKSKGQHDFFDAYPGFIHWLFPIPESTGRNAEAQPLLDHEAEAIRNDDTLSSRVLEAFKVMLDLYGMQLCDDVQGKFKRIEKTYKERYDYLQRYRENYLRITRILISIGELGLERFQVPWIDFLISEGIDNAMFPTVDGQCIQHWISVIKDEGEQYVMFLKYQNLAGLRAIVVESEDDGCF